MADMNATDLMLFFTPSVPQQDLHWGENSGPTLNFPLPPPQTHWADKLTVGAFVFFFEGNIDVFCPSKKGDWNYFHKIRCHCYKYHKRLCNVFDKNCTPCWTFITMFASPRGGMQMRIHFLFFFCIFWSGENMLFCVFFLLCFFLYLLGNSLDLQIFLPLDLVINRDQFFVDFFWHFGCFFWPTNNISLNQHVSKF